MAKYGVPVWIRPLEGLVVVDAKSNEDARNRVKAGEGALAAEDVNSVIRCDVSGLRKAPVRALPCVVNNTTYYYDDEPDDITPGYSFDLADWDNDKGVPW